MRVCDVCGTRVFSNSHTNFSHNLGVTFWRMRNKTNKEKAEEFIYCIFGDYPEEDRKESIFEVMECTSHYVNMIPELWDAIEDLVSLEYSDYRRHKLRYPAKYDYSKFRYEIKGVRGVYATKNLDINNTITTEIFDESGKRIGLLYPNERREEYTKEEIDIWYRGYKQGESNGKNEIRNAMYNVLGISKLIHNN